MATKTKRNERTAAVVAVVFICIRQGVVGQPAALPTDCKGSLTGVFTDSTAAR
eukprot:SAG31_NODE_28497_length_409_cov_1.000000_1_plen_52_part_01